MYQVWGEIKLKKQYYFHMFIKYSLMFVKSCTDVLCLEIAILRKYQAFTIVPFQIKQN